MTLGVYQIAHTASGRFYIGSSIDCEKRFYQHAYLLDRHRHHNKYLQNIWSKHGGGEFVFGVVSVHATREEALDAEQSLIDEKYADALCMNSTRDVRFPLLDPEVVQRAKVTRLTSEDYKAIRRKVCVDRNSDPIFQAKAKAGILRSAKFAQARAKGWKILRTPEVLEKNRAALQSSEKQKAAARATALRNLASGKMEPKRKAVVGTRISDGEEVWFESQSAAARYVGSYSSSISTACSRAELSAKGYRWRNA